MDEILELGGVLQIAENIVCPVYAGLCHFLDLPEFIVFGLLVYREQPVSHRAGQLVNVRERPHGAVPRIVNVYNHALIPRVVLRGDIRFHCSTVEVRLWTCVNAFDSVVLAAFVEIFGNGLRQSFVIDRCHIFRVA